MGINDQFTDEESAYDLAFSHRSCCCAIDCKCGRTFFVSCKGHGDYNEGELAGYIEKANKQPDKYIDSSVFDRIAVDVFGYVIQCPCGGSQRYIAFLEANRTEIIEYLVIRYDQIVKEAADEHARVSKELSQLNKVKDLPGENCGQK